MSALLGPAQTSASPPPGWPGPPAAGDGETLIQVSFWVSALPRVLDVIDAAARDRGLCPAVAGPAGAGLLYVRLGAGDSGPGDRAGFVAALRSALAADRGGVAVLVAPAPVRAALAGEGGMAGTVPALALMRAVKDRFDPDHRMAPGRFPDVI
jgi:glycolate oxidase FAD binding subunit